MLLLAVAIIAVVLIVRRVEVRLVLLDAGFAMVLAAGTPLTLADTFARGMVTAMVAPTCASMGFAAVITATGYDRHFVHLLLTPVRRVRWLVVPGGHKDPLIGGRILYFPLALYGRCALSLPV